MNVEDSIKRRAVKIRWDNKFSTAAIMPLFGLTRKQAREYIRL